MKLLIKQACITDPLSSHHGTVQDILIEQGIISRMAPDISDPADRVIEQKGLQVSPGWVDIFSNFADPGFEFKETLETGAAAAAAGGFTDVFLIPDTQPVTDNKSQVEYLRQRSGNLPVSIWPIGAITKNLDGRHLAEMYDMQNSGAVAFSDGLHPVQSSGVLVKALQYVKAFNGVIIQIPDDTSISPNGLIHEGIISTRLGLPGKPMMSEELIIARDIKLARYTQSRIHFTGVTSPKSIEYIRRGKDAGLDISCSVTPYHLFFNDEALVDYDTNLKVYPPLRPPSVTRLLREALMDGTIDSIASHHLPHEYDSKILEFEHAKFGMTGLETAYGVIQTLFPDLPAEKIYALFGGNARKIFKLPPATIEIGEKACMTLFDPAAGWIFSTEASRSKSRNSAFHLSAFTGRPLGTVRDEKLFLINP
ncbi:MAG TPA: dihydroorotase [Chitinophagaceae bacterium]|nr:dihydroorotase [Chitinophagaceae bacterium]